MTSTASYEAVSKASPRSREDVNEFEEAAVLGEGEKARLVSADQPSPAAAPISPGQFTLKLVILICVTLQNTSYALIRRYSRGPLHETYSTSSALLAMELAKLLLSAERVINCGLPSDVPDGSVLSKYCFLLKTSAKMTVPAIIYLIMNMLGFLSLSYVDAATFSIVAQLKVAFQP